MGEWQPVKQSQGLAPLELDPVHGMLETSFLFLPDLNLHLHPNLAALQLGESKT